MGEKQVQLDTSLTVKECGLAFQAGISGGRGFSARAGGLTAKLMGGESLSWYTPGNDSVFAALDDDQPDFVVGCGVPKIQGAHINGSNVEMYVWDRGSYRQVVLWAHHSLTGGLHASKLIDAVRAGIPPLEAGSRRQETIGRAPVEPRGEVGRSTIISASTSKDRSGAGTMGERPIREERDAVTQPGKIDYTRRKPRRPQN
jgi:hypothetical protein